MKNDFRSYDRQGTGNDAAAGLLLVLIRGVLLWALVPIGFVCWVLTVALVRVPLPQFLGWLDNNLVFLLQRGPLRVGFPEPSVSWVYVRDIATVQHRIRWSQDFA